MNPNEAELSYPWQDQVPAPGQLQAIVPGQLYWLRMPLPFALNHINLWLLKDETGSTARPETGWAIVDCGVNNPGTKAAWQDIFTDSAAELLGLPMTRVIATHCHPDHVGMAHWLCQHWQVDLHMSAGEYGFARMMSAGLAGADGSAGLDHFRRHGLSDAAMHEQVTQRKNYYPSLVPELPSSYVRLHAGQSLRLAASDWQVICGFGHSPEHVCLYSAGANILISGDMLLPRISTNVSVFAIEPLANPVQQYLDSLSVLAELPEDVLVLPAHGKPFRGLRQRIRQLRDHHAARLAEVYQACCDGSKSACEIVPIMFPRALDPHQLTFAIGEALAHCHQLWYAGKLQRIVGEDGVIRFAT